MTHPYLTEWRESHLTEWRDTDMAERITLEAPELRPVGQVPCAATSTGLLMGDKYVRPKRCQTHAECMGESLDYTDGPASIELYQLLLNAAAGADVQAQANELLGRMAVTFAKFNAEAA